ncbi:MAG: LysE family transporter [Pyramidobacter sp.]|jgi:cysteine/O-acetylserine efflux protein
MNWFSFFSYVAVATFTPGPNNLSSMSHAIRYGLAQTLHYRLGILCGFFTVQLLAALSSAALLNFIPAARPYMLFLGAAYILWMAWKTLTSHSDVQTSSATEATFTAGVLLQFVNVKVIIYALTVMSTFVLPYTRSVALLCAFAFGLAFTAFISVTLWAAFGALFSRILRRQERLLNVVMALLLVYCAVSLYL